MRSTDGKSKTAVSNFAQPQGAPHQGISPHAYTPTDEELLARARAWLAAGGTLVRTAYETDDGRPGVCWQVLAASGVILEGLPQRIAEAVIDGGGLERTEAGPTVTRFRRREP